MEIKKNENYIIFAKYLLLYNFKNMINNFIYVGFYD